MPSSFLRRHVRGLLRNRHGGSQDASPDEEELPTPSNEAAPFLSQCYLAGIDGRRIDFPEVYCGKTGLDIPCIQLQPFDSEVFATFTGPDGGLMEVGEVRRQPMVRMANLDDEMSLSTDGTSEDEEEEGEEGEEIDQGTGRLTRHTKTRSEALLGSCSSLIGPSGHCHQLGKGADRFDWSRADTSRAFGISSSLYEKNPLTGVNAGEPVADVWGVVARNNNGVLALADGVNWGEGARLAARCAVRGAIDHLDGQIEAATMANTTEVFHELLAAFHSAHSLILQEGGLLTTLCVAVVVPAKHGNSWVLCVCNVGDSLCFVYNRNYGVREVTLGSHDIDQMRDMRDAGGALGPVDGRNPQLHNLTCSMTFVEEGDMVFVTSDGVSDNFDPVVGKFCVIRNEGRDDKENSHLPPREPQQRNLSITTKDSPSREFARNRACAASLPCVDAARRHELMLVRMRDIIANGTDPPKEPRLCSPRHEPLFSRVSASTLCNRLVHFATQLSMAKRRTLENPELYTSGKMTKAEHRAKRRAVREKIADMPGKLDHASVVCYRVGRKNEGERSLQSPSSLSPSPLPVSALPLNSPIFSEVNTIFHNHSQSETASCSASIIGGEKLSARLSIRLLDKQPRTQSNCNHPLNEILEPRTPLAERPVSPYEQLPVTTVRVLEGRRKKHARGSAGRHTLGVDVQWLKRLVGKADDTTEETTSTTVAEVPSESSISSERISLRKRLRGLLGSSRNLRTDSATPMDTNQVLAPNGAAPRCQANQPARPHALSIRSSYEQ